MRTIIISDAHGYPQLITNALTAAGFVEGRDRFIYAGDIVDRGPDPEACFELVDRLADVALFGNHDIACAFELDITPQDAAGRALSARLRERALSATSKWSFAFPVDGILVTHGGVSETWRDTFSDCDCDVNRLAGALNAAAFQAVQAQSQLMGGDWPDGILGFDGPLWFRPIDDGLPLIGVSQVVGHTPIEFLGPNADDSLSMFGVTAIDPGAYRFNHTEGPGDHYRCAVVEDGGVRILKSGTPDEPKPDDSDDSDGDYSSHGGPLTLVCGLALNAPHGRIHEHLDSLNRTLVRARETGHPCPTSLAAIELDDRAVFDALSQGGADRLESPVLGRLVRELRPASIAGLAAALAFCNPLRVTGFAEYVRRAHGGERSPVAPELEGFLRETYGLFMYREQLLAIASGIGQMSDESAKRLLGLLLHRFTDGKEELRTQFLGGCIRGGLEQPAALGIWNALDEAGVRTVAWADAHGRALLAYWDEHLVTRFPNERALEQARDLESWDFGPFEGVKNTPSISALSHLEHGTGTQAALDSVAAAIAGGNTGLWVGRLFAKDSWWFHLVAAVTYLLQAPGLDPLDLWVAIDRGSRATPQLLVAALLTDPLFPTRASNRMTAPGTGCTAVTGILALCEHVPTLAEREQEWRSDPRIRALIDDSPPWQNREDRTRQWLQRVRSEFESRGISLEVRSGRL